MHEFKEEATWLKEKARESKRCKQREDLKEVLRRLWIIKAVNKEYIDLMKVLPVYENLRRVNMVSKHYDYPQFRKFVKVEDDG